jgi:hypothetical protein
LQTAPIVSALRGRLPPASGARVEQLLILEVADLRDRDVVELVLQDLADGADRQRLARTAAAGIGRAG